MSEFLALAIADFAIEGLVWGFAGFFVFRLLGGQHRWWIGILGAAVVSLAEEAFVFLPLARVLDLRIGNEEVSDLIGTDRVVNLITFDPFSDLAISVLAVAVGFMIAGWLDERRARRGAMARPGAAG